MKALCLNFWLAASLALCSCGVTGQGGDMYLALEVEPSELGDAAGADAADRVSAVIEKRLDRLGVRERSLRREGENRIAIELRGVGDRRTARDIIVKTGRLEFRIVLSDSTRERALKIVESVVSGRDYEPGARDMDREQEIADMLFGGGMSGHSAAAPAGTLNTMIDCLAYLGDQVIVKSDNVGRVDEYLRRRDVRAALDSAGLGGNVFLWGKEDFHADRNSESAYKFLYYVNAAPEMSGDIIKSASAMVSQDGMYTSRLQSGWRRDIANWIYRLMASVRKAERAQIDIELKADSARRFSKITLRNIGKQLAFVIDSEVYVAPRVFAAISGDRAEITGDFTMEEANALAIVLSSGTLPAPVTIVEER